MASNAFQIYGSIFLNSKDSDAKLDATSRQYNNLFRQLGKTGDIVKKIGSGIAATGTAILGVSTAIGGAALKMYMPFEDSMAQIRTLCADDTIFAGIKDNVLKMSSELGIAATEIGAAIYDGLSSGVSPENISDFTEKMVKLSKAGFTEVSTATDVCTTILNAYGMEITETDKIMDRLIQTQDAGKVTVGELGASMGKVIPTAASMGISIDQLCSGYALLTKQGIGSAEATTYMNSMFNELGKSGTDVSDILKQKTGKSFQELMASGADLSDVLGVIKEHADANGLSMQDLFGNTNSAKAAIALFTEDGAAFKEEMLGMASSTGKLAKNFEIVDNTLSSKISKSVEKVKNAFIRLGEKLVPIFEEQVMPMIDKFCNYLENLDEATLENMANWVEWGVKIGLAMIAGGKLISSIGSIMTTLSALNGAVAAATGGLGIMSGGLAVVASAAAPVLAVLAALAGAMYVWHEANEVANSSVLKSKEEYSLLERAIAELTGTQLRSKEELQELGLVYEDFNENISEDFQDAVNNMRKDYAEFCMDLNKFNLDGVFTEEEIAVVNQRVNSLVDGAIGTINRRKEEVTSSIKTLLMSDSDWSEIDQQTLEYWDQHYSAESAKVIELQGKINQIIQNAHKEGRWELTAEEIAQIQEYYNQIQQIELEAQADNSYEILYAQQEFQAKVKNIDAEGAIELFKQRQGQFREQQLETQAQYNTLIEMEKQNQVNLSAEEVAASEQRIANLVATRDAQLQKNLEYYNIDLETLNGHCENLGMVLDEYNADVMSNEDIKYNQQLQNAISHYDGINKITEDGCYRLYNTQTESWDRVVVNVDEATGEIVGYAAVMTDGLGNYTTECSGYNTDLAESTREMAAKHGAATQDIINKIQSGAYSYDAATGSIVNSNGEVVGSIKQVEDENGNLITSIYNVNGTPIHVGDNSDTVTSNLQKVINKVKETNGKTATVTITQKLKTVGEKIGNFFNSVFSAKGNEGVMAKAVGGAVTRTATVLVGEQGPELVQLPEGSKVKTHRETNNLVNNKPQVIQVVLDGRVIAESIAPYTGQAQANRNKQERW